MSPGPSDTVDVKIDLFEGAIVIAFDEESTSAACLEAPWRHEVLSDMSSAHSQAYALSLEPFRRPLAAVLEMHHNKLPFARMHI